MTSTAYNLLGKLNWKGLAAVARRGLGGGQEQKQDDLADFYYQQVIGLNVHIRVAIFDYLESLNFVIHI